MRYTLECAPMNDETIVIVGVLFDKINTLNEELGCLFETDRSLVEKITYLQSKLNWYQSKDLQDREWYEENKRYLRHTTSKYWYNQCLVTLTVSLPSQIYPIRNTILYQVLIIQLNAIMISNNSKMILWSDPTHHTIWWWYVPWKITHPKVRSSLYLSTLRCCGIRMHFFTRRWFRSEWVTSQIFCNLSELCLLAWSVLLHGQIPSSGNQLHVNVHQDGSDQSEGGFFIQEPPTTLVLRLSSLLTRSIMFMVRIRFSYSFGNAVALILLSANLGWIQGQFNFTENSLHYPD